MDPRAAATRLVGEVIRQSSTSELADVSVFVPTGSTCYPAHDNRRDTASASVNRHHPPLMRRASDRWLFALYLVTALVVVAQQSWTHIDFNFEIFRRAFDHLRAGRDLYAPYPLEQVDRFKYSPTFALLFAPFALLPTIPALALWNSLNVLSLWYAVRRLLPGRDGNIVLLIVFVEVVRTTQRAQSNALVVALMVLAFVHLEQRRQLAASVSLVLGTSIKLFPLLGVVPALFHPRRARMALCMIVTGVSAILLPLVMTSGRGLFAQYRSWLTLEIADSTAGVTGGGAGLYGGVMHWVRAVLGVAWPNWPIQLAGGVVLLAPLARTAAGSDRDFRLRFLGSLLLFSTIFNHQVESPSFVIAMTGVAIWYVRSPRRFADRALLAVTFVILSLGTNELMPEAIRAFVVQYKIKILPCLVVWLVAQYQLLTGRRVRA